MSRNGRISYDVSLYTGYNGSKLIGVNTAATSTVLETTTYSKVYEVLVVARTSKGPNNDLDPSSIIIVTEGILN